MHLKALGDHLSSQYLKGIGDSVGNALKDIRDLFSNALRGVDTLWEMPEEQWRPDGRISHQVFS
jgi:hypothetical protein